MAKKHQDDLERNIMNSYWKSYRDLSVTFSPALIALALLVLVTFWKPSALHGMLSSFIFITGFSGVIIIVKREIPLVFYSITGMQAMGEGIIFTLVCWAMALYLHLHGL